MSLHCEGLDEASEGWPELGTPCALGRVDSMVHLWALEMLILPVGTTSDARVRVLSISPGDRHRTRDRTALRVTTLRAKTASASWLHDKRQMYVMQ